MKLRALLFSLFMIPLCSNAKSMMITFQELIAQSKSIYVAVMLSNTKKGNSYDLDVETVLKGKSASGKITVNKALGRPWTNQGKRFIAFINSKDQLEWGGYFDKDSSVSLTGYYDRDGYDVSPDVVTMKQLREFISKKHFSGSFEGNFCFYDFGTRTYDTSGMHMQMKYDYYGDDSAIYKIEYSGFNGKSFTNKEDVSLGSDIVIEYIGYNGKNLYLDAFVDRFDADQETSHGYCTIREPEDLDSTLFVKFLCDPNFRAIWYEMNFVVNEKDTFVMTYGKFPGRIGYLVMGKDTLECSTGGLPDVNDPGFYKFADYWNPTVDVELDKLPALPKYHYAFNEEWPSDLQKLRMMSFKGRFLIREGGVLVDKGSCVVSLRAEHYD